jgi:ketosteroid isomerase-like protein
MDHAAIVHAFFDHLADGAIDEWMALLGPDIIADTPFAPDPQPRRFDGATSVRNRFGNARERMQSLEFYDREIHHTNDGLVVATCRSRGVLGDGRLYQNMYCWIFTISDNPGSDNVISHWVEYFDPLQLPS